MTLTLAIVIIFMLFAALVWRENARDERESLHKMIAGRAAFLAGTITLVIGIVVQTFQHRVDPWLTIVLSVMVLAKILGIIYTRTNR